jgi:ribulose-phosphate 3-epimerase
MSATVSVSASILAADFARLGDEIHRAEDSGCDEIHFDVMDGHFVPNISFGPVVLEAVRGLTGLPVDVHMMVTEPARYARTFADAGGDIFTVHAEACADLDATVAAVRETGMRAAVCINPPTPVSEVQRFIGDVNRVLVMTVIPGFGGQSLMLEALPKITELRGIATGVHAELDIAVDGGVKVENAAQVIAAGASTLISGTGLFKYSDGMAEAVRKMKGH